MRLRDRLNQPPPHFARGVRELVPAEEPKPQSNRGRLHGTRQSEADVIRYDVTIETTI